jgi:hypothetical protein
MQLNSALLFAMSSLYDDIEVVFGGADYFSSVENIDECENCSFNDFLCIESS